MNKVQLLQPGAVNFSQVAGALEPDVQHRLNDWWRAHNRSRPALFNGRLIACHRHQLASDGALDVEWFVTSYAHYLQRANPDAVTDPARAIYCSVALLTMAGDVVVGEMADSTAAPHQWQLPGGNVQVCDGTSLTVKICANNACRELAEELGLELEPTDLALWRVKTSGSFDDVGLIFVNRIRIAQELVLTNFERHLAKLRAQKVAPEIEALHFIHKLEPDQGLHRKLVDYLPAVVNELAANLGRGAAQDE